MFESQNAIYALLAIRSTIYARLIAALAIASIAFTLDSTLLGQQFPSQPDLDRSRIQVPGFSQAPAKTLVEQVSPKSAGENVLEKVEFSDTPLEPALRLFSLESGLQVIASDAAKKLRITVSIRNMSASLALKELTRQSNTFFQARSYNGCLHNLRSGRTRFEVMGPRIPYPV